MGLAIIEPIGQIELEWQGTTLPSNLKTGMRVTTADGAVYRLVKNSLGSALTNKLAYLLRTSTTGELTVGAAADDASNGPVGIVQLAAVADATYFWIGTGGFLSFTSAGGITANNAITLSTTDGKFDDTAITGKFMNAWISGTAASGADEVRTLYCPGELFYSASN
jgi:hypothetical protein